MKNIKNFITFENEDIEDLISGFEDLGIYQPLESWVLDMESNCGGDLDRFLFVCVAHTRSEAAGLIFNYYDEDLIDEYIDEEEREEIFQSIKNGTFSFQEVIDLMNKQDDSGEVSDSSQFDIKGVYVLGRNSSSKKQEMYHIEVYRNKMRLDEIIDNLKKVNQQLMTLVGKNLDSIKSYEENN